MADYYTEKQIKDIFSKYKKCLRDLAFDSANATRFCEEDHDSVWEGITDPFVIDASKIRNSKAFRREMDKTQVFPGRINPHIRNRSSHTSEVSALAFMLGDALGLNKELCLAAAEGHDLGHPPYGHEGEIVLSHLSGREMVHALFSVFIANHVERRGRGLGLCDQTLEGILYHSSGKKDLEDKEQELEETRIVRVSDKFAYVANDPKDFERAGIEIDNPYEFIRFGRTARQRVACFAAALMEESGEKGHVAFKESEVAVAFNKYKKFLYDRVYPLVNRTEARLAIKRVYDFLRLYSHVDVAPEIVIALSTDLKIEHVNDLLAHCNDLGRLSIGQINRVKDELFDWDTQYILKGIEGKPNRYWDEKYCLRKV